MNGWGPGWSVPGLGPADVGGGGGTRRRRLSFGSRIATPVPSGPTATLTTWGSRERELRQGMGPQGAKGRQGRTSGPPVAPPSPRPRGETPDPKAPSQRELRPRTGRPGAHPERWARGLLGRASAPRLPSLSPVQKALRPGRGWAGGEAEGPARGGGRRQRGGEWNYQGR